jgi:Domain of unknown function (DUF5615)
LRQAGFDAVHTGEIGLAEAPDEEILRRASLEDRVVVTLDADFHALLALSKLGTASRSLARTLASATVIVLAAAPSPATASAIRSFAQSWNGLSGSRASMMTLVSNKITASPV